MDYNLNLNQTSNNRQSSNSSPRQTAVRVVDVILDSDHPSYVDNSYIGAVHFNYIDRPLLKDSTSLPIAFKGNAQLSTLPLKNEIVLIYTAPTETVNDNSETDIKLYYSSVVGIYNTPNNNAAPGLNSSDTSLGEFKESADVNPLFPFPGDILIEGRQGQSLRFTGNKSKNNPFTDDSNNTKPLVILSNGQKDVGNGVDNIVEDINQDFSSIYLTSDHTIPLDQVRTKSDTFITPEPGADSFKGSQVLVNSGRLFFNAYDDSIFHTSNRAFAVSAETVNLDAVKYVGLDGKKIYLGSQALRDESQPVLLGNSTELYLQQFITALKTFSTALQGAKTLDPTINTQAGFLTAQLNSLLTNINPAGPSKLKSKKVFTE